MNTSSAPPGVPHWLPKPHAAEAPSILTCAATGFTPARGPQSLLGRVTAIEGFDVELAQRYTGGHPLVVARVLRRFVATYRQGLPTLLDVAGSEHEVILRWRMACHSLRAALALIGATRLVDAASGFESAMNELAPFASLISKGRQLHDLLVEFVGRIAFGFENWATVTT